MTNRAIQNWPEEMTYELTVRNTSVNDRVLDRRNDLRNVRAPYAHELNTSGTQCSLECAACKWVQFNGEVK